MDSYRIIVTDDHVLFRQGLIRLLSSFTGLEIVGEAGDGIELLTLLQQGNLNPQLVILDISMPNLGGIDAIRRIKPLYPGLKILILTMHRDKEYLYEVLAAGADGYFLKEDAIEELFAAVERIRKGKMYISPKLSNILDDDWNRIRRGFGKQLLTNRQRDILRMIAGGKSNKEIADILSISVHTVERHRANIMIRLHLKNSAELVRYAIQKGYV